MKTEITLTGSDQSKHNRGTETNRSVQPIIPVADTNLVNPEVKKPKPNLDTDTAIDIAACGIVFLPNPLNETIGEVLLLIAEQISELTATKDIRYPVLVTVITSEAPFNARILYKSNIVSKIPIEGDVLAIR